MARAEARRKKTSARKNRPLNDLTGWPRDHRERRDFYNDPRSYPGEIIDWRTRMVERAIAEPERFPAVPCDAEVPEVRALLDQGSAHLRAVARLLALLHGNPRLGNHDDPVDELVYIILSRKTREEAYQRAFAALKKKYASWDAVLRARPATIRKLIHGGGLEEKKVESILGALGRLKEEFGSCTLEPARKWSDEELESFLCSMPEIQKKTAYCIMMYSLGRKVFPADAHVGRILTRIGPYRELGLDLRGLDHKKLQVILADLIPPELRHGLHVNLVAHGRTTCPARKPDCASCELRNFCAHNRRQLAEAVAESDAPTVVDLFTGAGGMSDGFRRARYRTVLATDLEPSALRTFWLNHPEVPDEKIVCRDIREFEKGELKKLVGRKRPDVLVGGPPCQGFSSVGHRSKRTLTGYQSTSDDRNYLYQYMIGAAIELKPRLFLMENVPGMSSARKGKRSFMEDAEHRMQEAGYRTEIWKLNSAAFGVPQERMRYFLVAAGKGVRSLPARPDEEYQDQRGGSFDLDALPPVSFEEATFDLPPREADQGLGVELWPDHAETPRHRRYLKKFGITSGSRLLFNHTVRYHNDSDLELYALLAPGEDSVHAIEKHGRDDLMKYRRDVFDDKYHRLRPDRPGKTIVAHLAKDGNGYIHPSQVRSITLREAARVQSFRDDFAFCGSASEQWIQLGNSVPPVMAAAIARSFLRALKGEA